MPEKVYQKRQEEVPSYLLTYNIGKAFHLAAPKTQKKWQDTYLYGQPYPQETKSLDDQKANPKENHQHKPQHIPASFSQKYFIALMASWTVLYLIKNKQSLLRQNRFWSKIWQLLEDL